MRRHVARSCPSLLVSMIGMLTLSGCAYLQVPKIDPTGECLFTKSPISTTPVYRDDPGMPQSGDDVGMTLSPRVTVAPVGSEVVLVAGVRGDDNYLRTNRRLEWSVAPDGVGHFVAVGKNGWTDWLLCDFNRPRKVDNTFAIGSTSRSYVRLDRGTETPTDDVNVLSGQGWVTVASANEGTSRVTVFAPSVPSWSERTRTTTIHWIDAQWSFPPPAIIASGTRHTFTTSVTRHTDQQPCVGWLVRYEIIDGPPGGFAPDGATSVEVRTDSNGRANAEISQKDPGPGMNRVSVQIIRPASPEHPEGKRFVVGSGMTSSTWTSPDLAMQISAPAAVDVGGQLRYRIDVSNPGDVPAEEVVVTDLLPATLTYLQSNPPAEISATDELQWKLGQLQARQTKTIEIDCRATQLGSVTNCAEAVGHGGAGPDGKLTASECATTTVTLPSVDVRIVGPAEVVVGHNVTFSIIVTNLSRVPVDDLLIRDKFGPGLEHAEVEKKSIDRDLGRLEPGDSQRIEVTFRAVQSGRLCHTVEIMNDLGISASAEGCVTAVTISTPSPGPTFSPGPVMADPSVSGGPRPALTGPFTQAPITVKMTGPTSLMEGDIAKFSIAVINTSGQTLNNVKVVDQFDGALYPVDVAKGYAWEGNNLVWTIASIGPGETAPLLDVHCECRRASTEACNRVTVTTEDGLKVEAVACLEIQPAKEGLVVTVTNVFDAVALGKYVTYEIRVTNRGQTVDYNVAVVATIPEGMALDRLRTTGSGEPSYTPNSSVVRFSTVPEIQPGETLSYRVKALTKQPGNHVFRAEVSSHKEPTWTLTEESTEVFQ